jgi:hypothetical protein
MGKIRSTKSEIRIKPKLQIFKWLDKFRILIILLFGFVSGFVPPGRDSNFGFPFYHFKQPTLVQVMKGIPGT